MVGAVRVGGLSIKFAWATHSTAASPDARTVGLDQTARRLLTNRSTTARMSVTQQVGGPRTAKEGKGQEIV